VNLQRQRRIAEVSPAISTPSSSPANSGMPQPSRIRVLIAHGDPLISAGLAVTLRKRGDFEAIVCSPALTASDMTSGDVVVADYDSGLRLIASAGADRHRVMILTHGDSEAKISHALEQGARGYLLLGCSVQELIDGLRSVHVGGLALGPLVARRIADCMQQRALTRREGDILRQMMLGLSNKQIARKLTLSVGTVKTHVKAVLGKLGASSRTQAVAIAQRRGILREESVSSPTRESGAKQEALRREDVARWLGMVSAESSLFESRRE
jgi:DNA-binding NarL/FixJ family response regulator